MEIPDELLCLFNAEVEERAGTYRVTIPEQELSDGDVNPGEPYRVALLRSESTATDVPIGELELSRNRSGPPVTEGERRRVDIEAIGEQGDGIARIDRGYVIIVPDTQKHDRVTVEITNVAENVAFAEVITREPYYE